MFASTGLDDGNVDGDDGTLAFILDGFILAIDEEKRNRYFDNSLAELVKRIMTIDDLCHVLKEVRSLNAQKLLVNTIGKDNIRAMDISPVQIHKLSYLIHVEYEQEFFVTAIQSRVYMSYLSDLNKDNYFRDIIGNTNQVKTLNDEFGDSRSDNMSSSIEAFLKIYKVIREEEKLSFIKEYIGLVKCISLIKTTTTLTLIVREMLLEQRYHFIVNDFGMDKLKLLLEAKNDNKDYLAIIATLPDSQRIEFHNQVIDDQQKEIRGKLNNIRERLEAVNYIMNPLFHVGVLINVKQGTQQKSVSTTAFSIIVEIENNKFAREYLAVYNRVVEIADKAAKVVRQPIDSVGAAFDHLRIWAVRAPAAQRLYEAIAQDKTVLRKQGS